MYFKNLIAVVTTVIYASTLAGASIAESLADQHVRAQINSEKKVSTKNKEVAKAANTASAAAASVPSANGNIGAGSAPSSVPSTNGSADAGSVPSSIPTNAGNLGAGSAPSSVPTNAGNVGAGGDPSSVPSDAGNVGAGNAPSSVDGSGESAAKGGTEYGETYRHETSIYKDDGSLWRVEYYDDDNRLYEYSNVEGYDKDTRSYTETVYRYDEENNVSVPVRTDTYVNGELVSSESH